MVHIPPLPTYPHVCPNGSEMLLTLKLPPISPATWISFKIPPAPGLDPIRRSRFSHLRILQEIQHPPPCRISAFPSMILLASMYVPGPTTNVKNTVIPLPPALAVRPSLCGPTPSMLTLFKFSTISFRFHQATVQFQLHRSYIGLTGSVVSPDASPATWRQCPGLQICYLSFLAWYLIESISSNFQLFSCRSLSRV